MSILILICFTQTEQVSEKDGVCSDVLLFGSTLRLFMEMLKFQVVITFQERPVHFILTNFCVQLESEITVVRRVYFVFFH